MADETRLIRGVLAGFVLGALRGPKQVMTATLFLLTENHVIIPGPDDRQQE